MKYRLLGTAKEEKKTDRNITYELKKAKNSK